MEQLPIGVIFVPERWYLHPVAWVLCISLCFLIVSCSSPETTVPTSVPRADITESGGAGVHSLAREPFGPEPLDYIIQPSATAAFPLVDTGGRPVFTGSTNSLLAMYEAGVIGVQPSGETVVTTDGALSMRELLGYLQARTDREGALGETDLLTDPRFVGTGEAGVEVEFAGVSSMMILAQQAIDRVLAEQFGVDGATIMTGDTINPYDPQNAHIVDPLLAQGYTGPIPVLRSGVSEDDPGNPQINYPPHLKNMGVYRISISCRILENTDGSQKLEAEATLYMSQAILDATEYEQAIMNGRIQRYIEAWRAVQEYRLSNPGADVPYKLLDEMRRAEEGAQMYFAMLIDRY